MNYLVNFLWWSRPELESVYTQMYELSTQSFLLNFKSDSWVHCPFVYGHTQAHHDDLFYRMFLDIYNLWSSGNNVFYVDIDVLCVADFTVFGRHKVMTMFAPAGKGELDLNAGVKYFPLEMDNEVWQLGIREWSAYLPKKDRIYNWGKDQDIYNIMMRSQPGFDRNAAIDYRLNYMPTACGEDAPQDPCLIHYWSSRGPYAAIEAMNSKFASRTGES